MKIRIECGELATRAGYRPGMMVADATEVTLLKFDCSEILCQMDIREVMEWLNSQGYTVHQEKAA